MLKNILNLEGAQLLSKKEQQTINGGRACLQNPTVPSGYGICVIGNCHVVYHCDSVCPDGTDPICHV